MISVPWIPSVALSSPVFSHPPFYHPSSRPSALPISLPPDTTLSSPPITPSTRLPSPPSTSSHPTSPHSTAPTPNLPPSPAETYSPSVQEKKQKRPTHVVYTGRYTGRCQLAARPQTSTHTIRTHVLSASNEKASIDVWGKKAPGVLRFGRGPGPRGCGWLLWGLDAGMTFDGGKRGGEVLLSKCAGYVGRY